jgi:hypothetical protein
MPGPASSHCCGSYEEVAHEPPRTLRKDDDGMMLCRDCAKDYHDYWDGMWKDHQSGMFGSGL